MQASLHSEAYLILMVVLWGSPLSLPQRYLKCRTLIRSGAKMRVVTTLVFTEQRASIVQVAGMHRKAIGPFLPTIKIRPF